MNGPVSCVLVVGVIASTLAVPVVASQSPIQGQFDVASSAHVAGQTEARMEAGVVHLKTRSVGFDLSADRVDLEWMDESGYATDAQDERRPLVTRADQYEQANGTFVGVTAQASPSDGPIEVLAFPGSDGNTRVTALGSGYSQAHRVADKQVTRVGQPPNGSVQTYEPPHFWYQVQGPWVGLGGLDTATVAGTFTIFVHNATLEFRNETETLSHWTGYRTEPGPTPGTERFEFRVTVIHVENGALRLDADDTVEAYGPKARASVAGSVFANGADGELSGPQARYTLDDANLGMKGNGHVEIRPIPDSGTSRGPVASGDTNSLRLATNGVFSVYERPGVSVERQAEAVPGLAWVSEHGLWIGLGLVVAGLLYAARYRLLGVYTEWRAYRRAVLEQRWIGWGDRAFQKRQFERALAWYKRAVERFPNSIEGWTSRATCLQELGEYGMAAVCYERAAKESGQNDYALAKGVQCAWKAGRYRMAKRLALSVAKRNPGDLLRLVDAQALEKLRKDPKIREALEEVEPTGTSYV